MRRIALTAVLFALLFVSRPDPVPAAPLASHVVYVPLAARQYPPRHGAGMGFPQCGDWDVLRPEWFYNWGYESSCSDAARYAHVYVDMIEKETDMDDPVGTEWLLGFNEPDLVSQSNLSPRHAAELWRIIESRHPDRRLVSPAPSQRHPDWLWQMVAEYRALYGESPRFEALAYHFYDMGVPGALAAYLGARRDEAAAQGYDVQIWLTEFGTCGDTAWMAESVAWLRSQPWVARWAWYGARVQPNGDCTSLLDDDGLTAYGERFVTLREAR